MGLQRSPRRALEVLIPFIVLGRVSSLGYKMEEGWVRLDESSSIAWGRL